MKDSRIRELLEFLDRFGFQRDGWASMKGPNAPTLRAILRESFQLKGAGRFVEAEGVLRRGLEHYPASPVLTSALAGVLLLQDRLAEAETLAQEALFHDPDDIRALTVMGNIAFRRRNYPEAIRLFRHALSIEEQPYLHYRLALACKETNALEAALTEISTALTLEPENLRYQKCKGEIYRKMGRTEEALVLFEGVYRRDPTDTFAYKMMIDLKVAGKTPQEAALAVEGLMRTSITAQNPHLHAELGNLWKRAGHLKKAEAAYRKALELDPGNRFVREHLGFCYAKMKNYPAVIEMLSPIFLADPGKLYVRSALFSAFRKTQRYEAFLALLKEALDRHAGMGWLWGEIRKVEKALQGADASADGGPGGDPPAGEGAS